MKISFVSDIACDRPMLSASKTENNEYDFSGMLSSLKPLFEDSDYIVGNLETIFASKNVPYNKGLRYNTPDSFLDEIKAAGFNVLTTANNHCFDAGIEGLKRTLELLDKADIKHTGTYNDKNDKRYIVLDLFGVRIAVLAYTYSLNRDDTVFIPKNIDDYVSLLRTCKDLSDTQSFFKRVINKITSVKVKRFIRILLHMPTISVYKDKLNSGMLEQEYFDKIKEEISSAKNEADYVFAMLHIGGQFNEEPGDYSEYMMNFFKECGVDAVIGHHPHCIQKAEMDDGKLYSYSLGGLTVSPSAIYVSHECKPEYSLVYHFCFDEKEKSVSKISFSFVKGVEDENAFLRELPLSEAYAEADSEGKKQIEEDIRVLLQRIKLPVSMDNLIRDEYFVFSGC